MKKITIYIISSILLSIYTNQSFAQTTEEKFQDIFITAGYTTAFGAALGAAMLSFHSNPTKHLRYIAIGASLGFISGSIFASYIVFSPSFATLNNKYKHEYENNLYAIQSSKNVITINPVFDAQKSKLLSINTGFNILTW